MANHEWDHLCELIATYRRNLQHLEKQVAQYGGLLHAPLPVVNQLLATREELERLQAELERLESAEALSRAAADARSVEIPPPIRVLVSSTIDDLREERDVAQVAIEGLSLQAVRGEAQYVGSQSASSLEASRVITRECDIYLGILGGRYGTVPHGETRSITEIEYDIAGDLDRPILLYLKTDVEVEPEQKAFCSRVSDAATGYLRRSFGATEVPQPLGQWIAQDLRRLIEEQMPERFADRPPAHGRTLVAALGHSPGAVIGLYHALARRGMRALQVRTLGPDDELVRQAAAICRVEFEKLGVPYRNSVLSREDMDDDGSIGEFKGRFAELLESELEAGAEVLVGVTSGRAVLSALMVMAAQGALAGRPPAEAARLSLWHLTVDPDTDRDGRLPDLGRFRSNESRWRELLAPPAARCKLVRVPVAGL